MICRYAIRWKDSTVYDESGYVAGEDMPDCFSKLHNWFFEDQMEDLGSIELSGVDWLDDEGDIIAADFSKPKTTISGTYIKQQAPYTEVETEVRNILAGRNKMIH